MSQARKPLMAGNWKMNLNHLEAIAVTQKLAFSLDDKDYDAVDVAVIPPFTDIRSVQTLIDGDHLRLRYGAQDISTHAQTWLQLCPCRAQRTPRVPQRKRRTR
jgi:triosephosphate isomerase